MRKFIVTIDRHTHVEIEADSSSAATLDALRAYPDAERVTAKPASHRHTFGVLAIARRHPTLFSRLTK